MAKELEFANKVVSAVDKLAQLKFLSPDKGSSLAVPLSEAQQKKAQGGRFERLVQDAKKYEGTTELQINFINAVYQEISRNAKDEGYTLSDICNIMSLAMKMNLDQKAIDKMVAIKDKDKGLKFEYNPNSEKGITKEQALAFHMLINKRVEADDPRNQLMMKRKAGISAQQKAIAEELGSYWKRLQEENPAKDRQKHEGKHEEGALKSNRYEKGGKLAIAQAVEQKLEEGVDAGNLVQFLQFINEQIKLNRKATGNVILHGGRGRLEGLLRKAKEAVINNVPNGDNLGKLYDYIAERKEEVQRKGDAFYKESAYASDLPNKIKLAEDVFKKLGDGTLTKDDVVAFRAINKGFTEKGSSLLHRAGKLDGILDDIEKQLSTPKKPRK